MLESSSGRRPRIVIVDYRTGNLNSVKKALQRVADPIISSSQRDILDAEKIILPGVGHFGRAMESLRALDLLEALNEFVVVKERPVLGICLGMELMAKTGEEGNAEGLGWLDAQAVRFSGLPSDHYKVPHMGWNQINIRKKSHLMSGIDEPSEFYFAHSYHLRLNDPTDLLSETDYGAAFPSAIERNNIFGVQFHPEKSHDVGGVIIKNFIDL